MSEEQTQPEDPIPFYPDHLSTEAKVAGVFTILILIIGAVGLFSPLGLGPPADPMNTPDHIKPEWYFLALYQILKYIPKTVGVVIPILGVGIVILWPFIDRKPDASPKAQKVRLIVSVIAVVSLIVLTIWGEVS